MMMKRSVFAAAGFFLTVNAHMFMSSPTPIAGSAPKDPLESTGANFPCHGVTLPGSGGQSMPVGSTQTLAFALGASTGHSSSVYMGGANTAVHGGGSCQLSVTYETDAEKIKQASAWKVIYSIEEGCPTNSLENLGAPYLFEGPLGPYNSSVACSDAHANGFDCVNSFDFTIPKGLKTGQATLAWTWFNVVGNREMYMNCAAIDVTGGESDDSGMADFPDIFLANIGGGKTDENFNVKFPNPGKYVTTKTATTTYTSSGAVITITPSKTYPLAIPSAFVGSGSSNSVASSVAASVAGTTTAASAYAAVTSAEVATTVSQSTLATIAGTAPTAAGSAYSTGSSGNSTSGTCGSGTVSCSSPGDVVCIGDSQFGICNIDYCAVTQSLATGTTCSSGTVSKRNDVIRRRSSRLHRHLPGAVHKHNF